MPVSMAQELLYVSPLDMSQSSYLALLLLHTISTITRDYMRQLLMMYDPY
jgi:hypothetical protein